MISASGTSYGRRSCPYGRSSPEPPPTACGHASGAGRSEAHLGPGPPWASRIRSAPRTSLRTRPESRCMWQAALCASVPTSARSCHKSQRCHAPNAERPRPSPPRHSRHPSPSPSPSPSPKPWRPLQPGRRRRPSDRLHAPPCRRSARAPQDDSAPSQPDAPPPREWPRPYRRRRQLPRRSVRLRPSPLPRPWPSQGEPRSRSPHPCRRRRHVRSR